MRYGFDYVVAFEAVDTTSPQIYLKGEIEFHSLGLPLGERIRKTLGSLAQEFIPGRQSGIRPVPRKLWRFDDRGSRIEVELPRDIAQEDTAWEERKKGFWNSIPVGDPSCPF